jgi:hypothetical protein
MRTTKLLTMMLIEKEFNSFPNPSKYSTLSFLWEDLSLFMIRKKNPSSTLYQSCRKCALAIPGKKVIGVCLGSQILAKALGATVMKGANGAEIGFSKVSVTNTAHNVFQGITSANLTAFHLHGDTFDLPPNTERLISSEKYENQMFSYKNKGYGIQCHFEVTYPMLEVWWKVHKEIPQTIGNISNEIKVKQQEMEANARILFDNIIASKAN